MKLKTNTVGSIVFTLRTGSYEGEIIEKIPEIAPFDFLYGTGTMLESFEKELEGLKEGDSFKFFIKSENAYGNYQEGMQVEFEKDFFVDNNGNFLEDEVVVNNFIPIKDDEGNTLNGKVLFFDDDVVKLDFNHPLADLDLYFDGNIVGVRIASDEEIKIGQVQTQWIETQPGDPDACHV